jgi:hypothetical protein
VLDRKIDLLTSWEIHQAMPVMRDLLSEDEAATYSERAQAMQDQDMEQRLQTTEGMCYGLRRDR